jgi:hypothetical protein
VPGFYAANESLTGSPPSVHKGIAVIDLCRPSDMHEQQLEVAATLKQDGYSPHVRALDFYTKPRWIIHVVSWVVGISP